MNKTWIFATMALALGTSCSKEKGIDIDDSSRQEILLGTGSTINVSPASRGYGAVGGLTGANNWNGETVYVYGINKNALADEDASDADKFYINAQAATAPTDAETGTLTWADPAVHFYYNGNDFYDFYAVHVDNAVTTPETALKIGAGTDLATTGFAVDVTIDGTQDLMVAMPDKTEDINGNDEVTDISKLYSAWSSRRGVRPNMIFKHLLTRLNFLAKCGNQEGSIPSGSEVLKITKIQVIDVINKGTVTIIPTDPKPEKQVFTEANESNIGTFEVKQKGENGLETLDPIELTGEAVDAGEDLLLVPNGEYKIKVTVSQTLDGENIERELDYTLNAKDVTLPEEGEPITQFLAGKIYNVTIVLYKAEEITIDCVLTPWENGGDATLDEETIGL